MLHDGLLIKVNRALFFRELEESHADIQTGTMDAMVLIRLWQCIGSGCSRVAQIQERFQNLNLERNSEY